MTDQLFAQVHGLASKSEGKLATAMTVLSVGLMAVVVIKELKGAFRDEFREWERHKERHEAKMGHAERVRQSQEPRERER